MSHGVPQAAMPVQPAAVHYVSIVNTCMQAAQATAITMTDSRKVTQLVVRHTGFSSPRRNRVAREPRSTSLPSSSAAGHGMIFSVAPTVTIRQPFGWRPKKLVVSRCPGVGRCEAIADLAVDFVYRRFSLNSVFYDHTKRGNVGNAPKACR